MAVALWWLLRVYAVDPSAQVSWLQSAAFSALVGGVVAITVALLKNRGDNKALSIKAFETLFAAHKAFYEGALANESQRADRCVGEVAVLTKQLADLAEKKDAEIRALHDRIEMLEHRGTNGT